MENSNVMTLPQGETLEPVIDFSGDAIGEDLARTTESKTIIAEKTAESIEAEAIAAGGEFLPPIDNESQNSKAPVEVEPNVSDKDYLESAESLLGALDFGNVLVLPWAYMRAAFNKDERAVIKMHQKRFQLASKAKPESKLRVMESDEVQELFERWLEVREIVDDIPFTDDEIKKLSGPLSRVLKKYAKKPGPEGELIMAVLAIYGTRLTPILGGLL